MLTTSELNLIRGADDVELTDALLEIVRCKLSIGQGITEEQALRLEQLVCDGHPPPSPSGKPRDHYNRQEIWNKTFEVLFAKPVLRADTVDKVIGKIEAWRAIQRGVL
jgi:hypothetical protein